MKNSTLPNIRIWSEDGRSTTHIEIDGKPVKGVTGISYHAAVHDVPKVTVELVSLEDSGIDISNANLEIKFHPQTVHEAMMVLGINGMYEYHGNVPVYVMDDGK